MTTSPGLRARKRAAMRQTISNTATEMFTSRGFDNVTIDEIAAAAGVGRMTVFNYFPRKEDMFFDRDEEGREAIRSALQQRDRDSDPVAALRSLVHRLMAEDSPYLQFSPKALTFIQTVRDSEALMARARAIRDELAEVITSTLTEPGDTPDAAIVLVAHLIVAAAATAFVQAHAVFQQTGEHGEAKRVFLMLIEKGLAGASVALKGTPQA